MNYDDVYFEMGMKDGARMHAAGQPRPAFNRKAVPYDCEAHGRQKGWDREHRRICTPSRWARLRAWLS